MSGWTKGRAQEAADMMASGMTARAVGLHYGVTRNSVLGAIFRLRKTSGAACMRQCRRVDYDVVAEMYLAGARLAAIADKVGTSVAHASTIVGRLGLPRRRSAEARQNMRSASQRRFAEARAS